VCLLQLAAERVHRGKGLSPSLWLLDDIDAELDTATGDRLWRLFDEAEGQRMVARLGYHSTEIKDGSIHQDTMFHVEQGIVTSAAVADRPPPPTSLP
jgi:DNA replication and repair protein RecF